MSDFSLSVTFFMELAKVDPKIRHKSGDIVFVVALNVRVGKGPLSTAKDGFEMIANVMEAAEFKVFFRAKDTRAPMLHWMLARKASEDLHVTFDVEMDPGRHPVGKLDIPDCRLIHKTHHDGGYVLTFSKWRSVGTPELLWGNDPVATPA